MTINSIRMRQIAIFALCMLIAVPGFGAEAENGERNVTSASIFTPPAGMTKSS